MYMNDSFACADLYTHREREKNMLHKRIKVSEVEDAASFITFGAILSADL